MNQSRMAKILKIITIISGIIGFLFLFHFIPIEGKYMANVIYPEVAYMYSPCLIYIWIMAIPCYIALFLFWRICSEISKNNSFCKENSKRLVRIGTLAFVEFILCFIAVVILAYLNMAQPGIVLLLFLFMFIAITITVIAVTLSHLVMKAYDLKQENDFTI